ncbi:unnamed protein product [Schistosoma intercalatum]|nr:unnamed protein product [Schistosoma intercalatum]
MGKRNLIFTQKICQLTKDTALSHYHNRLLYEFSRIKECEVLKTYKEDFSNMAVELVIKLVNYFPLDV